MRAGEGIAEGKHRSSERLALLCVVCVLAGVGWGRWVEAADWPTYRGDNARSSASAAKIHPELSLHWTYKPTHPPKLAWPKPAEEIHRMDFDRAYYVTSANGLVYFGGSADDQVCALDLETGQVRWRFFTGGPVRFAPTVWKDRVYAGSDDGYVYCLSGTDGKLVWRYRPGPSEQKLMGNGRMISMWPIRTSVVVDDGVVYFAAGVFPYEGIYLTAIRADDGRVVWKNDTFGDKAHELSFGGITPQGYLLASKQVLYVPAGRAMPALFDRGTGQFRGLCSAGGKTGGTWALLTEDHLIAGVDHSGTPAKIAYNARTGARKGDAFAWFAGIDLVVSGKRAYTVTPTGVYGIDRARFRELAKVLSDVEKQQKRKKDSLSAYQRQRAKAKPARQKDLDAKIKQTTEKLAELVAQGDKLKNDLYEWRHAARDLCSLLLAGDVLFAGGRDTVVALDTTTGRMLWSGEVDGTACGLAAADGRLLVSTDRGTIQCFGPKGAKARVVERVPTRTPYPKDKLTPAYESMAKRILDETGLDKGCCLVLGARDGRLAYELAKRSQLKVIGLELDVAKVAEARKRLDAAGMLGVRAVVEPWDLSAIPDYVANLIVSERVEASGKASYPAKELYRVLRPSGGVVYLGRPKAALGAGQAADPAPMVEYLKTAGLAKPVVSTEGGVWVQATRGPLVGAGAWTQLYGSPSNTGCSDDRIVRAPLGVLWFGEPGPDTMVERHARAASPVAINGRLFVQGEEVVTGVDAYNGTILWRRQIPGAVRVRVDVDGGNLAATADALYVAAENLCYRLDPADGHVVRTYELPPSPDRSVRRWGFVAAAGKTVFGSAALPLKNEYAALWKALVSDGAWKDLDQVPPTLASALRRMRDLYPVPDDLARAEMQRAGTLWRTITHFPVWGSQKTPENALTPQMMVSDAVFAVDADTGQRRWVHRGKRIPHISITIGDGTVYLLDSPVTAEQRTAALKDKAALIEQGIHEPGDEAKLGKRIADIRLVVALDGATGERRWSKPVDLTGCGGDKLGVAYEDGLLVFLGHFSDHDGRLFSGNSLRWRRITTMDAKTGCVVWSRPLNYLRRPVVVGDTILIEPRACDLRTGEIKTRSHPITGETVPFEFLRPGHSCGITSAAPNAFFYRSYCGAIYDLAQDGGLVLFGGIRPGCWLNLVAANGLLTMPEASSGCTCSFPLRCSVALKPRRRPEPKPWSVFITHGPKTPVRHLAVNFGAPGDRKDAQGTLWWGYPRPKAWYADRMALYPMVLDKMGTFCHDFKGVTIAGTDKPWLFTSGYQGLVKCKLPLIDDIWSEGGGVYTVRLGFAAPPGDKPGQRVFDVRLQGKTVLKGLDVAAAAGGASRAVVREFKGVRVATDLAVELVPKAAKPTPAQAPVVNCIEAVQEQGPVVADTGGAAKPLEEDRARSLLAKADATAARNADEALAAYHALFDGAPTVTLKVAALKGIAAIGSPKSLSRIARYVRTVDPILRNYQDWPVALTQAGMDAFLAIASNVGETNKDKAVRMLRHAMQLAKDQSARDRAARRLDKLGVPIDAEPAGKGFVTRWHIIGPVPWDAKGNTLDTPLIGEPAVDLKRTHDVGKKTLRWQPFITDVPMVNLELLYGEVKSGAAYAYAEVVLDKDEDLLLKAGSDDRFKAWFNGEAAGKCEDDRDWQPDQNALEVNGKRGVNKILVKVSNLHSDWGFSVRLTTRTGGRVKFAQQ